MPFRFVREILQKKKKTLKGKKLLRKKYGKIYEVIKGVYSG